MSESWPMTLVYMLAHARREPFYIDVTTSVGAAHLRSREIIHQRTLARQVIREAAILVWYETCDCEAAARARAAEIRAWPHPWQRQLIDQMNPDWRDLDAVRAGFPEPIPRISE